MEIVIVGDSSLPWYKQCKDYVDTRKKNEAKILELCSKYDIGEKDFAYDSDTFYVLAIDGYERFKAWAKKDLYFNDRLGTIPYYVIKKTSQLGKDFKNLNLAANRKPILTLELLEVRGGIRASQLLYEDKIYIRILSDYDIPIPKGFTEMKLYDYLKFVEDLEKQGCKYDVV